MNGIMDSFRHDLVGTSENTKWFLASTSSTSDSNKRSQLQVLPRRCTLAKPIRQTTSIFKQPVTVQKSSSSEVKVQLTVGKNQEKPLRLLWHEAFRDLNAHVIRNEELDYRGIRRGMRFMGLNLNFDDDSNPSDLSDSNFKEEKKIPKKIKRKPRRKGRRNARRN